MLLLHLLLLLLVPIAHALSLVHFMGADCTGESADEGLIEMKIGTMYTTCGRWLLLAELQSQSCGESSPS